MDDHQEPVAWMLEWSFNGDEVGRRIYDDETHCKFDAGNEGGVCRPLIYGDTAPQPVQAEPVAKAWDEGYRAGVNDERMSEANIGIAGFGAKVEPARNNPYRTTPQRTWVGLTDEEINVIDAGTMFHEAPEWEMRFARAIEAKLKEKNT
jgi:hypothetical protein